MVNQIHPLSPPGTWVDFTMLEQWCILNQQNGLEDRP